MFSKFVAKVIVDLNSTATVTKEMLIRTKKLRKMVKVRKLSTLRNGREGTKTATEYELRLDMMTAFSVFD